MASAFFQTNGFKASDPSDAWQTAWQLRGNWTGRLKTNGFKASRPVSPSAFLFKPIVLMHQIRPMLRREIKMFNRGISPGETVKKIVGQRTNG